MSQLDPSTHDVESTRLFKLKTVDDRLLTFKASALRQSKLLSPMIECIQIGEDDFIPLNAIKELRADVVTKIFEWCEQNENREFDRWGRTCQGTYDPRIIFTKEDTRFLNVSSDFLFDMVVAVDYLNIPKLCELLTSWIAKMADYKTVRQIRETYMLPKNVSREDVKIACGDRPRINRDNYWFNKRPK